jgi:hypothetical protein
MRGIPATRSCKRWAVRSIKSKPNKVSYKDFELWADLLFAFAFVYLIYMLIR